MTTKQADKIIKDGQPVTVHNKTYGETFTALFVRRDRHNIYAQYGSTFDRTELEVVKQ